MGQVGQVIENIGEKGFRRMHRKENKDDGYEIEYSINFGNGKEYYETIGIKVREEGEENVVFIGDSIIDMLETTEYNPVRGKVILGDYYGIPQDHDKLTIDDITELEIDYEINEELKGLIKGFQSKKGLARLKELIDSNGWDYKIKVYGVYYELSGITFEYIKK